MGDDRWDIIEKLAEVMFMLATQTSEHGGLYKSLKK